MEIKDYTEEEINYIICNYQNHTVKEISNYLNKKDSDVYRIIRKLGLKKQIHKSWSNEDNEYLISNYMKISEEIASVLSRSVSSVNAQRDRLGLVKHNIWSEDEIKFLNDNYKTMTHREIADKIGRTEQAVRAKCFDLKLFKKEEMWSEHEIQYLKDNYREKTKQEISNHLCRSQDAIQLKARKLGIKKYPYTCNYKFFKKIDTEEKAYWLGFMTADGWVSMNKETNSGVIGVELQHSDIEHLKKFNKSINGNYKISERKRECPISKKNKIIHTCVLRIFSLSMYQDLINIGFSNNKSFDANIPFLSNDLYRHFIRGYFDGNGTVYVSNQRLGVRFCTASKTLNERLISILKTEGIELSSIEMINENGNVIYYPEAKTKQDKINLLDYMYKNSSVYLDRKYKKYLKAKELHNT